MSNHRTNTDDGSNFSESSTSGSSTPLVQKQVTTSASDNERQNAAPPGIKSATNELTKAGASAAGGRPGPSVALLRYMELLKPTLTPDDAQVAYGLIEQFPHLDKNFTAIVAFLVVISQRPHGYGNLADLLEAIGNMVIEKEACVRLGSFAVTVKFEEKCAKLYHQILREKRLSCVTEIYRERADGPTVCMYQLMRTLLNFTCYSLELGLRLAETGLLHDFMESIKAMKDKTDEYLESSKAYFYYLGCLQNLSKSVEVMPAIRKLKPFQHISPFLSRQSLSVKLAALMALAALLDEQEGKQLTADGDTLQIFLSHFQEACRDEKRRSRLRGHFNLYVDEFLRALYGLVKIESIKRFVFEMGFVPLLVSIIESGTEEERRLAIGVIWELAFDKENSSKIAKNERLMKVLNSIKMSTDTSSGYAANAEWVIRDRSLYETRGSPKSGTLGLRQNNLRKILGKSDVEFALDQLRPKSAASGRPASATYTRAQVLAELRDLVQDGTNRQEFLDKGGIDVLALILENADDEERLQTLYLLLDLSENAEICSILKAHTLLMPLVEKLKVSVDSTLAQVAHRLARILQTTDEEETARTLDSRGDILVSCHKGDKHKASLVVDHLRRHKYKVRLHAAGDTEDEVEGEAIPTPDETSRPVDGASVVLFCVSLRYKKNKLCRMQCEYAANCKLHKDLIAVLVDTDYRPDGWLQDVLHKKVKVVVDVTDSGSREKELEKLVATLGDRGKGT